MSVLVDPGLQPERTTLAWRRTALSLAFNAVLLLRTGLQEHRASLVAIGIGLGVGCVLVIRFASRRERGFAAEFVVMQTWPMLLVSSLAVLGGLGLVLIHAIR